MMPSLQPRKADPPSKNRAWGFSAVTYSCTGATWSQVPDTHREISTNATNVLITIDGTPTLANTYTFDAAERASAIDGTGGTFAFDYGSHNGLVSSVSNSVSGDRAEYAFDDLDRLTNIVWRNAANGVLRSFGYGYNDAGMITNVSRETGSRTAYQYDSLDRLTDETVYTSGGGVINAYSWKYDLAGNRTQAVVSASTTS